MITAAKKLKGSDGKIGGLQHLAGAPEVEESDEERELTNLNWLLRNQNLSWPKTIDANSEDDVNGQVGSNRSLSTAAAEGVNAQKKPKALEYDTLKHMTNKSCPDSRKSSAATAPLKRPSPAERYDIFINKIKRDLVEYEKSANTYKTDVTHKPPFNYSHIIGMAMLENGRVTLQQICAWIEAKFAFFRVRKKWNNSIRHNLSLHHCFRNRKREEKGKGGYWELGVDPKKCDRKRIRNRKTTQSKLNPVSDLSKNQSQLSKYQFTNNEIRSHRTQDSHTPDEKPRNSRLDSSDNNMAEQDVQLDCLTLTEVEVGLGLTLPNALSPRVHDPDATFLFPDTLPATLTTNNEAFHLQQQYELGTIIISTTGILEEPSCLNSLISNKFGCSNMIYKEDEIPTASENVTISSHKMDANRDANVALIASSEMPIPGSFTINYDYSNFRPFMDSVDESFGYLQSSEINRNEDILDNLLDVCVRDY
ncbi:uncharacterized protein [Drosophila virilis]|uniref:Fork-head domain-containing protein n=1 Tax=Drosophila virilis TaxID=7244 RepID=B4MF21_DROVI|nr:uncharacterized protein LOC6636255 [Drosophila virilis]ACY70520.1 hypothetical protein DVIR88_6g0057 [Drosophila virilis]EDW71122.1 uncharacterized protein Dvir_GJ19567 [Drosophila virilis]